MSERVVVLATATINPLGHTTEESFEAAIAGKCGLSVLPEELADIPGRVGGLIKNFREEDYVTDPNKRWAYHRSATLTIAASRMANAEIRPLLEPHEEGVIIGTGIGGASSYGLITRAIDSGETALLDSNIIQGILPEAVSTLVSLDQGITGPAYSPVAACATGNISITDAYTLLTNEKARGDIKVMLAGGVDATVNPESLAGFWAARMLSKRKNRPDEASLPFSLRANGFVMAEGVGVLVLALESFALKYKLPILAEIVGFGNTNDAHDMFFPSGKGGLDAMVRACEMAKITPDEIDYINAHDPGTPGGRKEAEIILELYKLFGKNTENLTVSSTKSMTGHMLGGTAAFEAIMCIMAINRGIIPPTINLYDPIRDDIDFVPLVAKHKNVEYAMNNSFGLKGINSVIIFRRYHPPAYIRFWQLYKEMIPRAA